MSTVINASVSTPVNSAATEAPSSVKAKELNVADWMYDIDWGNCEFEVDQEIAEMFANIMLPNNLNLADPDDVAMLPKLKERQSKLIKLILETGFNPLPIPEELVIVYRGRGINYPKPLATAFYIWNTKLWAINEVREKGKLRYRPAEDKEILTKEISSFEVGTNKMFLAGRTLYPEPINANDIEGKLCVYADELASFHAAFAAIQMQKLTDLQLAELAILLRPNLNLHNEEDEIGVLAPKDNQTYYFSFSNKWVTTRSGRNPKVLNKSVIWLQTVDSRFVMFNLAMWLGAARFDGSVDGEYIKIPNLFSRVTEEGGTSYSVEWEADHPTRVINEDLRMPLNFVARKADANLAVYPFTFPENVNHNPALLSKIIQREGDATCDKYNTTFVGGALASNAAGTLMVGDKKRTIHDMKGTKMLNRPMQARKHMSAFAELVTRDGEVISTRERSKFTVKREVTGIITSYTE